MARRRGGRLLRGLRVGAAALLGLAAAGALAGWLALRASLPRLDGVEALPGLSGEVRVARDALGVPSIEGRTRLDVARATGFVHAQDRLFQMDLLRRRSAGTLAELVGAPGLPADRAIRVHALARVAERALAATSAEERALLEAYAEGVNAGRAALGARPFEYLLLRAKPAPWRPVDSLLVALTLFVELNGDDDGYESCLGALHDALPPEVARFLTPTGTSWDAPLLGGPVAQPAAPGPEVLDFRRTPPVGTRPGAELPGPAPDARKTAGSNAFAVAGSRTADGRALLASDMHLRLSVPGIWYRAALAWDEAGGARRRVVGVTLPGAPLVIVGSNGQVAWGFTNSYADLQDLVELELDPADPERYRVPGGWARLEHRVEALGVKGGAPQELRVDWTAYGPVLGPDRRGRVRALRWTVQEPGAVSLGLAGLERAARVEDAVAVAHRSGIPPQNMVAADTGGHIAWTIAGRLPRRVGFDGRLPGPWGDGARRWDGLLPPDEVPALLDPPEGLLWTANQRIADGAVGRLLGDGGPWLGARAGQIRDDLRALARPTERDLLGVQLDDRARFLARWQRLLREVLLRPAGSGSTLPAARRVEARGLVEAWGARAAVDSAGYRLVRAFRVAVLERALAPFDPERPPERGLFGTSYLTQAEGPVWALVTERPPHLLDPAYGSWDALLEAAATDAVVGLGPGPLARHPWGEANTASIRHPLSAALPLPRALATALLDMPREPLPGDVHMPRFQSPEAGASERLVVSPGREQDGIFELPAGQSGHPLSPYYRAGHRAWVEGRAAPLLPGAAEHALRLVPPAHAGTR